METYDIKSIIDIIEVSKKYERGRKRARPSKTAYNNDLERLRFCIKPLKKLEIMVGMDEIKKNIIDQILFYAQELNTNEMMHICLTGPPGVGKTTVGKILAELYCSMGFLKTDRFNVVGRSDLIGGYLGQTAIKTKKVLKSSLGGVLFIDEAYSLGSGKGSDDDSYAKECIDTINQFLSENTENFIMIIAGYRDELDRCFFNMNPGLRRRFPWVYNIGEYSLTNLKDIFVYQVKENEWEFDDLIKFNNYEKLDEIFSNKEYFKNNGGDTLALFDKSKICHSRRVFGKRRSAKKYLNFTDIKLAFELIKTEKAKVKTNEPPFGMYL
jgi:SpoVK/Ycf46/Vps4 family AAA+-type ATPase